MADILPCMVAWVNVCWIGFVTPIAAHANGGAQWRGLAVVGVDLVN